MFPNPKRLDDERGYLSHLSVNDATRIKRVPARDITYQSTVRIVTIKVHILARSTTVTCWHFKRLFFLSFYLLQTDIFFSFLSIFHQARFWKFEIRNLHTMKYTYSSMSISFSWYSIKKIDFLLIEKSIQYK